MSVLREKQETFSASPEEVKRSIWNVIHSHHLYRDASEDEDGKGFILKVIPYIFGFGYSALMNISLEAEEQQTSVTVQVMTDLYSDSKEIDSLKSVDLYARMIEHFLAFLKEEVERSLLRPASAPVRAEQTLLHPADKEAQTPPGELLRAGEPEKET